MILLSLFLLMKKKYQSDHKIHHARQDQISIRGVEKSLITFRSKTCNVADDNGKNGHKNYRKLTDQKCG